LNVTHDSSHPLTSKYDRQNKQKTHTHNNNNNTQTQTATLRHKQQHADKHSNTQTKTHKANKQNTFYMYKCNVEWTANRFYLE